jgi:uncharacterized protein
MDNRTIDTAAVIAAMNPTLDDSLWAFVTVVDQAQAMSFMGHALATFRENEGLSLIVPYPFVQAQGHDAEPYARITLQVYSALAGVGLTAAVSAAITDKGIACNMVAAYHHDHVFVPAARADDALAALQKLQADTRP